MIDDREKNSQLSEILDLLAERLDVPPESYAEVCRKYEDLGTWLKKDHLERFRSDAAIYPQGSIRLGTSVCPIDPKGDFDVDIVYRRDLKKEAKTQEELKNELEDQLQEYLAHLHASHSEVPGLQEGRRCWTLRYGDRFHVDILPGLPDDEAAEFNLRSIEDGILIPDSELRNWQHSNPKGYAAWFDERQGLILSERREQMAKDNEVAVEDIPQERVSTPLRRSIQILKRHRDLRHEGSPDTKPISVIITTLAAIAYRNETDVVATLMTIVPGIRRGLERRDEVYWVANPINPKENFADKWQASPERATAFFEWLGRLEADLGLVLAQTGIHKVAEALAPALGQPVVAEAVARYAKRMHELRTAGKLGIDTRTGILSTSGATPIPRHTNYGRERA